MHNTTARMVAHPGNASQRFAPTPQRNTSPSGLGSAPGSAVQPGDPEPPAEAPLAGGARARRRRRQHRRGRRLIVLLVTLALKSLVEWRSRREQAANSLPSEYRP